MSRSREAALKWKSPGLEDDPLPDAEIEPSKEIRGGAWYVEGHLDKDLIEGLKKICLRIVSVQKVATIDSVYEAIEENRIVKDCTRQQVEEILNFLVLGNEILEVKSTGLGEYHSIPIGALFYRIANVPPPPSTPAVEQQSSRSIWERLSELNLEFEI